MLEDRQRSTQWIEQAHRDGARLKPACRVAGIDVRTLQRWKSCGLTQGDRRSAAIRPPQAHALTDQERERILQIANEPRFAELPPARIVPMLADEGIYIASESSFSPGASSPWSAPASWSIQDTSAYEATQYTRGHGTAAVVVLGSHLPC